VFPIFPRLTPFTMKDFQDWPWWLQTLICLPFVLAFWLLFDTIMNALDPNFSEKAREHNAERMTDY